MSNFERQLLNSAQEGADGSGNSVGAHLLSKLAKGNADPKHVNEEIRQKIVRGGRGSKGESLEIKKSIDKAKEEAVHIDDTLSKLKNEKEGLLRTIADFRIKERQLVETGKKDEVNAIRKAITNAQNEIDKINGVVPESVALDDHKKIQSIVSEWYAEKQKAKEATLKIKQAEKKLEATPNDGRILGDAIRGKTEKAEAEEQLAEAEREAELILKNKTPNPVRDEGVHHTNEETIEERNFLNHRRSERVAPGIFGHKEENEDMQRKMDELATSTGETSMQQQSESATINETSVEEKNMKQEMPPPEFTLNSTEDVGDLARVEEQIKEVSARQAELAGESNEPFQKSEIGEEFEELKKEMSSLEERQKEIEAKKPLQSAYDMAMDRIWKENEAKRNAALEKTEGSTVSSEITPEPTESDIEHDIEIHNAILPITIEGTEEVVGAPREGQEGAFEKFEGVANEPETPKLELTPEQAELVKKFEKSSVEQMIANASILVEMADAEAEKKKLPEGTIRRVGEAWNKIPTRYKLLLTAGMIASGVGSAAIGATTAVGTIAVVGAGLRAVGGAGLFVAIERGLKNHAEKKGGKRSGLDELRDTTLAAALSIIIVGVLPNMARDLAVEHGFFQKISELFGFGGAQVEAPVKSGEYIQIAKSGDSVWKMAGSIVGEKFPDLSPDQKTYLIDAIKDRIEKYPVSYGLTDANKIIPGQGVDFGGIFEDKEFMDSALSSAKNLTLEQTTDIQNYDTSSSVETPAREVSAEEFLNETLHTTFTPEQTIPTQEAGPKDFLMEEFTNKAPEKASLSSFIQPEILPGDVAGLAQIEAGADTILHNDIDLLLGESKFLWFGHTDGVDSINWKDPQVGFSGKTVTEIMSSNPGTLPVNGGKTFGIENYEATSKMKEYLRSVASMSGLHHNSNENVVDFIHRASVAKLSK